MKISNIIDNDKKILAQYFLFFNTRKLDNNNFISVITYKKSKFANMKLNEAVYKKNNHLMSNFFGLDFKLEKNTHILKIYNDLNLDLNKYYKKLYSSILKYNHSDNKKNTDKFLFLSLFGVRGSIDITNNFVATDIFEDILIDVPEYIKYLSSMIISTNVIKQFNFNFRNFQPEYITGKSKRNPQIRINLRWFYDNYGNHLKKINKYKFNILEYQSDLILEKSSVVKYNKSSVERMLFFHENVLNQKLIESDINRLREELNFPVEFSDKDEKNYRNREIVILAKAMLPDECVSCKDIYNIENRSFKLRKNNKWYLEIHHVIPYYNGESSDVIENLVKLCPTCHAALTRNRAYEKLQKEIIYNILKNSEISKNYISLISDLEKEHDLVNYVYNRL